MHLNLKRFLWTYLLVFSGFAVANTPPTKPGNLNGLSLSSSIVALDWDASTDDKRVRYYQVHLNEIQVGKTQSPEFVLSGLSQDTTYRIDVDASDGNSYSLLSSLTIRTPAKDNLIEEEVFQYGLNDKNVSEETVMLREIEYSYQRKNLQLHQNLHQNL